MISSTDYKFINIAIDEAKKSVVLMRHGAVAVANGKVLGKGYNNYRTNSKDLFITNSCTCHAEIAALRNLFYACKLQNNVKDIKVGNFKYEYG